MARFPGPSPARSRHRRPLGRPPHPVALRPGEPSLSFCAALQEGTTSHTSPQARCFPGNALRRASPRIHPPQLVILLPGLPLLRPPFAPSLPRCLAHSKCDVRLAPCPVTFSASPYSRNPNPASHTSASYSAAPPHTHPTPPTAALPSTIAAVPAPVPATATAARRTAIATSVPARVPATATAVAAKGTVEETGGRGGRARARRRATGGGGSVGVSGGRRASPSSTRRPPGAWRRRVWGRCPG